MTFTVYKLNCWPCDIWKTPLEIPENRECAILTKNTFDFQHYETKMHDDSDLHFRFSVNFES